MRPKRPEQGGSGFGDRIRVMNPFEIAAPDYASVRPAYPAAAVEALLGGTAPGRPFARVADVGAGTGKMTALLAARGCEVVAVEPSEAMREQMRSALGLAEEPASGPGAIVQSAASAEALDLADSSVDLVVFAQSWHWVDPTSAAAEAARVLMPGGVLAAVWNQMDVSIPWVRRLTRIMRSGDVHRADRPPAFGPAFEPPSLRAVPWADVMTPEEIVRLGTTRSSYLRQDPAGRARMSANLRWYLHEHLGRPEGTSVEIPYSTLVWTARMR